MTESEQVAADWLVENVRRLSCDTCGGSWIVAAETGPTILYHNCHRPRGGYDWRTPRQRHDDQRQKWAGALFAGFESAVGDDALLPVE